MEVDILSKKRPDASTPDVVAAEAVKRGIEVRKLKNFTNGKDDILVCKYRDHVEYVYYSGCSRLSYVTDMLFRNKAITTHELKLAGFPVPDEIITADEREAVNFLDQYGEVVVKPIANTGGNGITLAVKTKEKLQRAMVLAREYNPEEEEEQRIVCQQQVEGRDWRVLVIDFKNVFVIERLPAYIEGDGVRTVRELAERYNQVVKSEVRIRINEEAEELAAEQGVALDKVVEAGVKVRLARVANYHSGGRLRDATDELGEDVKNMARRIARYFQVGVVGIDMIAADLSGKDGYVIELNSKPDLTIHHFPHFGTSRNAVGAFLDMLFPEIS